MFVGHALLAFALAALVADWRGHRRRSALTVGVVAGAFAAIPDVDVAYALVGLLEWQAGDGVLGASTAFWDASRAVHRSATHSLVVGAVAAPAFGLLAVRGPSARARAARIGGLATLAALVAIAFVGGGAITALVMGLFAVCGFLIVHRVARDATLSPTTVAVLALWGLWSHPWGDLVTGSPPDLLFPLSASVLESHVALHPDPTLHLLGAFAIELATIWLALAVVCRLTDRSVFAAVDRRAGVGAVYGLAALAVTPPTLDVSYHFVFSILGVGLLCGVVRSAPSTTLPTPRRWRVRGLASSGGLPSSGLEAVLTGLTGVSVALVAYATVYLVAGAPT